MTGIFRRISRRDRRNRKRTERGAIPSHPWHGRDPILSKFRLKDLQRHGYIDYRSPEYLAKLRETGIADKNPGPIPPISADLHIPLEQKAKFFAIFKNLPPQAPHVVFRRDNWQSISDDQFELLEPALRMASCILHEPCVLPFFTGLRQHRSEILDAPEVITAKFGKLYRFETAPMPGNNKERDEFEATFMYMNQMKKFVQFTFGGTQDACDGHTAIRRDNDDKVVEGFFPGTAATTIHLDNHFLDILTDTILPTSCQKASLIDPIASLCRTHFLLAKTLVHEYAHAFWLTTCRQPTQQHEPFLNNQRVAELGSALERTIWGLQTEPSGCNTRVDVQGYARTHMAAPYGIQGWDWPGTLLALGHGRPDAPYLGSPAHWGTTLDWRFPVLMHDIRAYFTNEFWAKHVSQTGLAATYLHRTIAVKAAPREPNVRIPYETGPDLNRERVFIETEDRILEKMGFKLKNDDEAESEDSDPDAGNWMM